jgi:hypothetical protein
MEPTKEQRDAQFREAVLRARRMTPGERVLEGFRLFDRECQLKREAIRAEFPDPDDACVEKILGERLERQRQLALPTCDVPIYVYR